MSVIMVMMMMMILVVVMVMSPWWWWWCTTVTVAGAVQAAQGAAACTGACYTGGSPAWPLTSALHQCTTLSLQCKLQIVTKHQNTEHVSEKGNARKWHKPARNCWWKNLKHFVEPVTPGIQEHSFTCGSHRLKCIECNTTHTLKCIKHIVST